MKPTTMRSRVKQFKRLSVLFQQKGLDSVDSPLGNHILKLSFLKLIMCASVQETCFWGVGSAFTYQIIPGI